MEYSENLKWRKARRRVEALKGFYKHLLIYNKLIHDTNISKF